MKKKIFVLIFVTVFLSMKKIFGLIIFSLILVATSSCHLIKGTTLHYAVVKEKVLTQVARLKTQDNKIIFPKVDSIQNRKTFLPLNESFCSIEKQFFISGNTSHFGGVRGGYFPADTIPQKPKPQKHHPKKHHEYVLLRGCTGCFPIIGIFIGTLGLYLATQSFAFSLLWILLMAFIISLFIGLYLHFIRKTNSKKYLEQQGGF